MKNRESGYTHRDILLLVELVNERANHGEIHPRVSQLCNARVSFFFVNEVSDSCMSLNIPAQRYTDHLSQKLAKKKIIKNKK